MSTHKSSSLPGHPSEPSVALWIGAVALAIMLWFAAYSQLVPMSDWIVSLLPLEQGSHLQEAIRFFVYDTPKVLMLLGLVVFVMGVARSYFSPERTRSLLARSRYQREG